VTRTNFANSEIMATLEQIRSAKNLVESRCLGENVSQADSLLLDDAYDALDKLETKLIVQDIQVWIGSIAADADRLRDFADQIQTGLGSLRDVPGALRDAAGALGALASVMSRAIRLGLVS